MSKRLWWTLLSLVIIAFLYRVRAVLTPFFFAIVIAYILYPLTDAVEKRGASRGVAILVVYAFFALLAGVSLWLVVPNLVAELETIVLELPEQAKEWEALSQRIVNFVRRMKLPNMVGEALNILVGRVELALETLAGKLAQVVMGAFTNLIALIISPILAYYLLKDHQAMRQRALQYVPAPFRGEAQAMMTEINRALNGFFRGQLVVSIFVGLFVYLGLFLLKIPYALFIGLIAGLFDIIPYFGPVLGFLPAAAFALLKSPLTVLWVLLLFAAANQIENGIISPKIIGDRVGLHPLVVIFAVLVGGDLLGILGMLIAVPVAATLRVVLEHFFLRRSIGSS